MKAVPSLDKEFLTLARRAVGFDRPSELAVSAATVLEERIALIERELVWEAPADAPAFHLQRRVLQEVAVGLRYLADRCAGRALPEPPKLPRPPKSNYGTGEVDV